MVGAVVVPRIEGDMDVLRGCAERLAVVGVGIADTGERVHATWQQLAPVYRAPEAGQLLVATEPVRIKSQAIGEDVEDCARALSAYGDAVAEIQVRLDRLRAQAAELDADAAAAVGGAVDPALEQRAAQLRAAVAEAMADFATAEQVCVARIGALTGGPPLWGSSYGVVAAANMDLAPGVAPPVDGTPAQNHAWWQGLTGGQRAALVRDDPGLVGNLDGVPIAVRDQANRVVLATVIARDASRVGYIRNRLHQIERQRPQFELFPTPSLAEEQRLQTELVRIEGRSVGTRAIADRLDSTVLPPGQLMGFEPDVGNGRAIVSVGYPDTADNVVTFVPGTGARLGTIGGDITRVDDVIEQATNADPAQTTAGITWHGYEAPQSLYLDAPRTVFADDAQPHLRGFQEGLRVTHEGPPSRNTVLAHSYGSTVVGHTARDGSLDADALVFAGSPGVGVDHVEELRRPPRSVYSTTSAADDISIANIRPTPPDGDPVGEALSRSLDAHGRDPSSPEFGGTVFHSDPRGGHSDYWSRIGGEPNPSLVSFGLIAVGRAPLQ